MKLVWFPWIYSVRNQFLEFSLDDKVVVISDALLVGMDWDLKETQPQLNVVIDYNRAADLGVSVGNMGRTLETMLGSRRVTTYNDQGEEYDVILEGVRDNQNTPISLQNIYVRSERLDPQSLSRELEER